MFGRHLLHVDEQIMTVEVLVLQLYLCRKQSLSVVMKLNNGLMPSAPIRSSPDINQRNNWLLKEFAQSAIMTDRMFYGARTMEFLPNLSCLFESYE